MKNEQTYAVISSGGKQYRVEEGQTLAVELLEEKIGKTVQFDEVLLVSNDGKVSVGTPTVKGASVSAKLEEEFRGDKVFVFKKKHRKGYRKKTGHRQNYHLLTIESISIDGKPSAKKAAPVKKEEAKEDKPQEKETKKAAPKKTADKKPAAKKAAPKKTAAKKPAAKKAAPKKEAAKKESKPKAKAATKKAAKAEVDDKE